MRSVNALVGKYRARCLWFLREGYYPRTPVEACRALEYIERHGDVAAFQKAVPLRQWLSRKFQRTVCRLIARQRRESGESYVAGGVALNTLTGATRISRDIAGFSPAAILEQAGRSSRCSAAEIAALDFAGTPPDAAELSQRWHAMLEEACEIVAALPPAETGRCVLDARGDLFGGDGSAPQARG